VKVDLTRVDSEAVPGVRDAKLLPSSRAIRAALVKTGETKMDRGMLAKAEWERQLRAKIQERERQQLEYEQAIPAAETPVELGVRQDERLLALELIKQDMEGGRLCDRSHAPALPEEEEIELEDSIDKQDDSTGLPTSSSKGSSPEDQLDEDGKLLGKFLADNGFDDPHQGRRRFWRTTYPLHVAAEKGNTKVVALLLSAGVMADQKNSSGRTALDVARKRNRNQSHQAVMLELGAGRE